MDCGSAFVKIILFLFNLLCAICGILLITFGSIVLSHLGPISQLPNNAQTALPIVAICLGSVVFIIAFLGCCGAIKENNCMTMTYALILLILLLCQIAFVVMVWVYQTQLIQEMDEGFDTIWKNHIKEPVPMDSFQTIFKCCGSTGYSDYRKNNETLPGSCCGTPGQTCEASNVYNQGCKTAFHSFWSKNIEYIKFGGLAIALIEFVGVVFACCLSNSIRNERRRAHY